MIRRACASLAVNDAAVAHYGMPRERFLASTLFDLYAEEEWPAVTMSRDFRRAATSDRPRLVEPHGGRTRHQRCRITRASSSSTNRPAMLLAIVDVTEQREAAARIAHLAHHDPLTGLANRALVPPAPDGRPAASRRGRGRPRRALSRSRRLQGCERRLRPSGRRQAARSPSPSVCGASCRRAISWRASAATNSPSCNSAPDGARPTVSPSVIVEALSRTYEIDGHPVTIGASVGISVAPADSDDADTLLKNADIALYRAKADGRGVHRFFEPEMAATIHRAAHAGGGSAPCAARRRVPDLLSAAHRHRDQ